MGKVIHDFEYIRKNQILEKEIAAAKVSKDPKIRKKVDYLEDLLWDLRAKWTQKVIDRLGL